MAEDGEDGGRAGLVRISVRRPLTAMMAGLLGAIVSRSTLGVLAAPSLDEVAAWLEEDECPYWEKAPRVLLGMSVDGLHRTGHLERFTAVDGREFWVAPWIDPDASPATPLLGVSCLPYDLEPSDGAAVIPIGSARSAAGREFLVSKGGAR
ncbi:hypothetical protein [Arthrobacter sp. efr-133-TYG-118]|uniref:hypothetical protein n=1 Tax=Arthrobacter sp. efr-133-TYG-118 TaxID=3040279 RepID=UPI00254EE68B|nr:hypothetical protein [Arthrobacter sp. efr-133-TYG-118]